MYRLEDGNIYNDDRLLGTTKEILVDTRQSEVDRQMEVVPPARLQTLPFGDYLFVTPSQHIVTLEEKRQDDLDTSWRARRVQRQLREAHAANPEGINGLALRLNNPLAWLGAEDGGTYYIRSNELLLDLAKLQLLGIPVVFLPGHKIVPHLEALRAIMQPGRHLLSPLAGEDNRKPREKLKGVAAAIRGGLPGVGAAIATRWAEASGQNLGRAFTMTEDELKQAGVPANVRRTLGGLRGE